MGNRTVIPAMPPVPRARRGRFALVVPVPALIEALPARTMLSVTPAVAARLEAEGFERMKWRGSAVYVEPGEWIVSINKLAGPAAAQVATVSARLGKLGRGIDVVSHLGRDGLFKVTAPRAMTPNLMRAVLRNVRNFGFVEPNTAVWAQGLFDLRDDAFYSQQYGLNNTGLTGGTADADIDAPEAWELAGGNLSDVVVGVIDTGVDYTHPDLAGSMWTNPFETAGDGIDNDGNGYVDDYYGADFVEFDGDPMDSNGHGTHVAGIIAGASNNAIGVTGVAPNAKIMALRFLDASGVGGIDGAVAALTYAADMKSRGVNIRVTNNSWGSDGFSSALDQAVRDNGEAGMLYVAAAGNGGEDQIGDDNDSIPFYPASLAATNILSVAASDRDDALGRLSNYGANSVDLAAPGLLVIGLLPNGDYGHLSGTSMATPLVSGVAAMAFGLHPDALWEAVHRAVLRGVDPVAAVSGKTVTGGRLNALGTLRAMEPTAVVGRSVFYNGSAFDGRSSAAGAADDAAIATDKTALLPGQTATFANYTSYSKGITGVMVDLRNSGGEVGATDLALAVRNSAGDWVATPGLGSVSVRGRAGALGSDRVTIVLADGAVRDMWLRVTVLAGAATGLTQDDVFYFGNAVGETGNSPINAVVNIVDVAATRAGQQSGTAQITSMVDFNRDGAVNAVDLSIVRGHRAATLPLITAPGGAAATGIASATTTDPTPIFSTSAITPLRRPMRRVGTYLQTQ